MYKKPSTLLSVLSAAKSGPGSREETHPSLKGLAVITGDVGMTGSTGNGGKVKSRFGATVYAAHKDCDNCSTFQVERRYAE